MAYHSCKSTEECDLLHPAVNFFKPSIPLPEWIDDLKILFVTSSCSDNKYSSILKMRKSPVLDPQQKFFRLLMEGVANGYSNEVDCLSIPPISASTIDQAAFNAECDEQNGVRYFYPAFRNGKFSRYATTAFASRKFIASWLEGNSGEDTVIVVDPLVAVAAFPVRSFAQKKDVLVVAVVTDLPMFATRMKERRQSGLKALLERAYQRFSQDETLKYDGYISLTQSIDDEVNPSHKPSIILEGISNAEDRTIEEFSDDFVMYAGGIYEKYGVKTLVKAFEEGCAGLQTELLLFGEGTYVDELLEEAHHDTRIKYMGCVPAEEVVKFEKKARLLVNPRPSDETFSKYSFPSKTMEYLLSGAPVVSTRLPGIPVEYFDHMFAFDDETSSGMGSTLKSLLTLPADELKKKGADGHDFVMREKNNLVAGNKVSAFLADMLSCMN